MPPPPALICSWPSSAHSNELFPHHLHHLKQGQIGYGSQTRCLNWKRSKQPATRIARLGKQNTSLQNINVSHELIFFSRAFCHLSEIVLGTSPSLSLLLLVVSGNQVPLQCLLLPTVSCLCNWHCTLQYCSHFSGDSESILYLILTSLKLKDNA